LKSSRFSKLSVSLAAVVTAALASAGAAHAVQNKVLLYGPSTFGGANSIEAQQAAAQGLGVDVVDGATWDSMTTAQFAQYRALIIPDNHDSSDNADLAAAEANTSVWGAAVNGNVLLTGADPEYHGDLSGGGGNDPGAVTFIDRSVAFAAGSPVQTGAYVALGGYYPGNGAPALVLDAFGPGQFSLTSDSTDAIHIDPAVTGPTGLSDAILSNWGNTAHRYFSRYPSTFRVWAIATDAPPLYTTSDGQQGEPNFLTRPAGPTCTVPKLKNKSLKKAKKKLRAANCALGKKKGHGKKVKKQKPKPGTLLPAGSKVKVTLH
jgi:PASTA domain-containing protein